VCSSDLEAGPQNTYPETRARKSSSLEERTQLGKMDSSGVGKSELQCEICSKAFARMSSKNRHVKEFHHKNFSCNSCSISFPNSMSLRKHCRIAHSSRTRFPGQPQSSRQVNKSDSFQGRESFGYDQLQSDVATGERPASLSASVAMAFSDRGVEFSGIPVRSVNSSRKWQCQSCSQSFFFKNYYTDHIEKCQTRSSGTSSSSMASISSSNMTRISSSSMTGSGHHGQAQGSNVQSQDPSTEVGHTELTGTGPTPNFNYWQQAASKGSRGDSVTNNNWFHYRVPSS